MNPPVAVQTWIADLAAQVLAGEIGEAYAAEEIGRRLRHEPFALDILSDWSRKRIRSWVHAQTAATIDGQLALPFPELHSHLEVSPGVTKHQTAMTGHDWDNALAIYRNRRKQADALLRQLERRYAQVRHLLTGDLTTAEALRSLAA